MVVVENGVDGLREIADALEREGMKVVALIVAVRQARAACESDPVAEAVVVPRQQWTALCRALDAIEDENES